jgi:hypothetical protein
MLVARFPPTCHEFPQCQAQEKLYAGCRFGVTAHSYSLRHRFDSWCNTAATAALQKHVFFLAIQCAHTGCFVGSLWWASWSIDGCLSCGIYSSEYFQGLNYYLYSLQAQQRQRDHKVFSTGVNGVNRGRWKLYFALGSLEEGDNHFTSFSNGGSDNHFDRWCASIGLKCLVEKTIAHSFWPTKWYVLKNIITRNCYDGYVVAMIEFSTTRWLMTPFTRTGGLGEGKAPSWEASENEFV